MTKVVKRNGQEVLFNKTKIKQAITKAMRNGSGIVKPDLARMTASDAENYFASAEKIGIGQIESYVVERLIHYGQTETALAYEKYKVLAALRRETKSTDEAIIGIVKGSNQEAIRENANKRGEQLSASRDLIADDVQKDIMLRKVLPVRVAENHLEGRIYIHDLGYNLGHSFNCCLTDLKTILEEGTVINDILIDPQKKFLTAMTVASQVAAQMTSSQWGGNTYSIAHLAPIARKAKEWHYKEKVAEYERLGVAVPEKKILEEAVRSWKKELTDGVQTFQYQLQTFATASGMSPFLTLGLNINEDSEYTSEIAEITEEIFKQRIQGVKNEAGVYVGVAFPKLVYVLDENNTYVGSEYRWLTELAAECNIKRMVPDYISAKVMKEQTGYVYFPMGN